MTKEEEDRNLRVEALKLAAHNYESYGLDEVMKAAERYYVMVTNMLAASTGEDIA